MQIPISKELVLRLLDSMEELTISNAKLKAMVQTREPHHPWGFSVEEEIRGTALDAEIERYCREPFALMRQAIDQSPDPNSLLKKLLEQFPGNTEPQ